MRKRITPNGVPMSNDSLLYDDLTICDWLKDGSHHTPTLPDLADKISQRPGMVLETGCGSGELLRLLRENHAFAPEFLWGCDIEPDHAELARRWTGLGNHIIQHNFNEGSPFPQIQFDYVTAINWLQSDWPYEYPVKIARAAHPGIHRFSEIINSAKACLRRDGLFIWDFHKISLGHELQRIIEQAGWNLVESMYFPCNQKRQYPEFYPIFFYQPPKH